MKYFVPGVTPNVVLTCSLIKTSVKCILSMRLEGCRDEPDSGCLTPVSFACLGGWHRQCRNWLRRGGSHQRLTVLDYGPQPKCGNYFTLICVRCKSINHVSVVHLAQPFLNYVLWDIKWCIMKKKVLKSSKFKKCWVKIKFLSKRFLKTVNLSIMWGIFYVAFSKFYLIQNPPGHIL